MIAHIDDFDCAHFFSLKINDLISKNAEFGVFDCETSSKLFLKDIFYNIDLIINF